METTAIRNDSIDLFYGESTMCRVPAALFRFPLPQLGYGPGGAHRRPMSRTCFIDSGISGRRFIYYRLYCSRNVQKTDTTFEERRHRNLVRRVQSDGLGSSRFDCLVGQT